MGVPHLTPRKLRHSAITAARDAAGGDVRQVRLLLVDGAYIDGTWMR